MDQQLMQRAEILQTILYTLGALAVGGGGGVGGWKLLHQPWPFLSLPLIGVAVGVPWLMTLFISEDQAKQMGALAFRHKLLWWFTVGVVSGAVTTLSAVVVLLYMLWGQPGQWPPSLV